MFIYRYKIYSSCSSLWLCCYIFVSNNKIKNAVSQYNLLSTINSSIRFCQNLRQMFARRRALWPWHLVVNTSRVLRFFCTFRMRQGGHGSSIRDSFDSVWSVDGVCQHCGSTPILVTYRLSPLRSAVVIEIEKCPTVNNPYSRIVFYESRNQHKQWKYRFLQSTFLRFNFKKKETAFNKWR